MAQEDSISIEDLKKIEVSGDEDVTPGYKTPAKVDLQTLKRMDADDESLQKYKGKLLDQGEIQDVGGPNVIVQELDILFENGNEVKFILSDSAEIEKLKSTPVELKEGTKYKLKITFRVQREIVAGLRYFHSVSRKGITVDKNSYMVGSYGPRASPYSYITLSEDEAPKGLLSRGRYTVDSKFVDDDKNEFLNWQWSFNIV